MATIVRWRLWVGMCCGLCMAPWAWAGDADAWLRQLNQAMQTHAYSGTMVISVGEQMATAQVLHAIKDQVSGDRIEVMTGEPRTTYRRGHDVVTVWPQQKMWVREVRHDLGLFAALNGEHGPAVDAHYLLKNLPPDRVAGRAAQVIELAPRDQARWAYRIWRDERTGLMLKLQTLSTDLVTVLEQTAFTSLDMQPDLSHVDWLQHLPQPKGFSGRTAQAREVDPDQWGVQLRAPVAGFVLQRVQLPASQLAPSEDHPLQWVFSDGLASLSVFYQPRKAADDAASSALERAIRMGATHTLLRLTPSMRVTVVGEAPMPTLRAFANALVVKNLSASH